MSIKSVNRSACAAFAPEAPYLATGTMAGVVDLQFSSSENLDLFELDFASDDQQLILAGSAPSSDRFIRLSWGKPLPNSSEFSLGLVAGGLVDGNIGIWNPKSLIEGGAALLQNLSRHRGPVRGLEFSPSSPNILASGADEEISIWDLANPTEPTHYPPLRGGGEISSLSWNSQVHHILASTSFSGTTVIWDLKKHKSVMSFSDSVRRRCSVLQWSPDESRHLVVASDEDESPSIRLWDLRNLAGPVREFAGHTKGVIAMSWCPIDSSYLLSCAKDNRTICWDTTSGEIVSELPAGTNCNFDVHWYPRIPGVISASSYDGKIGLYNIEGNRQGGGGVAAESFRRPPKWYTRKAGVSFGFGGKLVSFNSSGVFEQKLVTEHNLVSRCSEFEAATNTGEKSCLRLLCEKRSEESESEDEKEIWGFLKVMFDEDGTARTKLLSHLGFSPPVEENNATTETDRIDDGEDFFNNVPDDGEDFFNNLPPSPKTAPGNGIDDFVAVEKVEEDEDQTFDNAVERALVVADYKGAVAQCISANRIADALVIAHAAGDAMLWESTRDQYLKTSSSRYLKVVAAMVNRDLMSLVNSRPLKSWKETIALVCTFAPEDEWTLLCETLASRLMAAGKTLPASLCFIGAGNIDKAVEIWSRTDAFEDLMEKTIVLALASGQKIFTASLCNLVGKYAEILAGQGLFSTAMEHLKILELSPELAVLQDRIARAMVPDQEIRRSTQISQDKHPLPNTVVQYPSPPHPDQFRQPPLPNIMLPPPISPQPDQSRWRPHSNIFLPYPNPPQPDQFRQPPQPNNILPSPSPPQPDQFRQPPQPNMFLPTPSPPQHDQFRQPPQAIMFMPSPINPPQPPQLRQQPVTPTIQTADTCNVPAQLKPVIATLTRLFRETSEAQPSKKRENDDGSKKLGALFMKLNSGDISRRAAEKLVETCQALDHGDLAKAIQLQTQLTATDWDECGAWLPTLKRMIKARQMDFS